MEREELRKFIMENVKLSDYKRAKSLADMARVPAKNLKKAIRFVVQKTKGDRTSSLNPENILRKTHKKFS